MLPQVVRLIRLSTRAEILSAMRGREIGDILLDKARHRRFRARHDHVAAALDRIARQGFRDKVNADMLDSVAEFRYQRRELSAGIAGAHMKKRSEPKKPV